MTEPSKLVLVRIVFFGRIVQISKFGAPADTIPAWFSHVWNSERYKQEAGLDNRDDLASVVTQNLGGRLAGSINSENEWWARNRQYLSSSLSVVSLIQLSTPVSTLY